MLAAAFVFALHLTAITSFSLGQKEASLIRLAGGIALVSRNGLGCNHFKPIHSILLIKFVASSLTTFTPTYLMAPSKN